MNTEVKAHYPANVLKFCPFCGSTNFENKSIKAFKCNSCGHPFYMNAAAAVAAIIQDEKGNILLAQRAFEPYQGLYDLPGGFTDPLETAEEALLREVKEEFNLDIIEYKYFDSFPNEYLYKGLTYFTLDLYFICKVKTFANMHIKDDVSGYKFITPDIESTSIIGPEPMRKMLCKYIELKSD